VPKTAALNLIRSCEAGPLNRCLLLFIGPACEALSNLKTKNIPYPKKVAEMDTSPEEEVLSVDLSNPDGAIRLFKSLSRWGWEQLMQETAPVSPVKISPPSPPSPEEPEAIKLYTQIGPNEYYDYTDPDYSNTNYFGSKGLQELRSASIEESIVPSSSNYIEDFFYKIANDTIAYTASASDAIKPIPKSPALETAVTSGGCNCSTVLASKNTTSASTLLLDPKDFGFDLNILFFMPTIDQIFVFVLTGLVLGCIIGRWGKKKRRFRIFQRRVHLQNDEEALIDTPVRVNNQVEVAGSSTAPAVAALPPPVTRHLPRSRPMSASQLQRARRLGRRPPLRHPIIVPIHNRQVTPYIGVESWNTSGRGRRIMCNELDAQILHPRRPRP